MAVDIAAQFQVLGEILHQYLTEQGAVPSVQHQGQGTTGVAPWFHILLKDRLELVIRAFSSEAGKQLEWSQEGSIASFRKILEAECSGSQTWVDLCSFEALVEAPSSGLKTMEDGETAAVGGRSDERQSKDIQEERETAITLKEISDQSTPKEGVLYHQSPSSGLGATEGSNFDNAQSDFAFPASVAATDLEPEDSPDCFIKKETLEALARQEQEASEAESLASISPDRSKQSPWKDSSRTFSPLGSPGASTPGAKKKGFWDNLRQGFSEKPAKSGSSLFGTPERKTQGDAAALREAPSSLKKGPESAGHATDAKPASKLLRTYMKSTSKAKSLCTFLEAAGPLRSDDPSEILAWSGLLSVTAVTLRMKKPHQPELRYLLRVVEHASDPGWPVTPVTLLALREKLQSFADSSLHAQLRQKEKILVKNLADGIGSMVRTVLEWYYLHLAIRVEAALKVAPVKVRMSPQGESELLSPQEIQTCFVSAAQRRYVDLKGHADLVTKQILLASLTRSVTAELRDQMQRYPLKLFSEQHPVRTATATFCQKLLEELQSLQASKTLEMNRNFFSLFEAVLGLDALSKDALEQEKADLQISTLPQQQMTPFLTEVCKVLEPYVINWISSVSDQLLRWDQSLVVSLAKQAPAPGSKGRTSRSLKDLFDGILRIAGSENARLVYKSAPRYAALLDKALCRVILNRTQAINVLCQKAMSQATKQFHLPLPPALKKWRLPATGPLLSPNVCVLLNDLREVRSRLSTLLIEIRTPPKEKLSETSTPTSVLSNVASPAVERMPPKPPRLTKDSANGSKGGFFSRLLSGNSIKSPPKSKARQEEDETSERDNSQKKALQRNGDDKKQEQSSESRTRRAKQAALRLESTSGGTPTKGSGEQSGASSAESSGATTERSKRRTGGDGDTNTSLFREMVVRSLSAPEKTLHKKVDNNKLLRIESAYSEKKQLELTANGSAKKEKSRGLRGFGVIKSGVSSKQTRSSESQLPPPEPEEVWAGKGKRTVSTSEERFAVLRMEIEKQYFELVRFVAHTIAQDFGPFLEAVISGPDHIQPGNPGPSDQRQGTSSDFGLALDARRRMKPLLDYLKGTFQEGWKLLDRSVLRRLARETWDASAEALLSLLPSFHVGASTNIAGRPQGPVNEDDELFYRDDDMSIDLSAFDEAAPRMRKVGAIAAHFEEVFGELIVNTGGSAPDAARKKIGSGGAGTAVIASEVPRNVRRLSELLNAFAGSGSAGSWSSAAYVR